MYICLWQENAWESHDAARVTSALTIIYEMLTRLVSHSLIHYRCHLVSQSCIFERFIDKVIGTRPKFASPNPRPYPCDFMTTLFAIFPPYQNTNKRKPKLLRQKVQLTNDDYS